MSQAAFNIFDALSAWSKTLSNWQRCLLVKLVGAVDFPDEALDEVGTGKHASADGTKWNLYEQNLLSEHHIRYGGYGGIGYYHVSDKFIALFSHFISCGTYEGIHILDGLMTNESDIRPDLIHGDTQAQSYPVFALAHLLGIQLMPRIRGIQYLKFHRPEPGNAYRNINALFSDVIDWRLIELHLPAMLRVAVSIKTGKITPSAILRRLGTYSRKNKLYFAFVGPPVRFVQIRPLSLDLEFFDLAAMLFGLVMVPGYDTLGTV